MTIYTDGTHLITDGDLEELHWFARSIRLRRSWFQGPPRHKKPHYDLTTARMTATAARSGARVVTLKETIYILHRRKAQRELFAGASL